MRCASAIDGSIGPTFASDADRTPAHKQTHPLLAVLGDQREQIRDAMFERLLLFAQRAEFAHALRHLVRECLFELVDVDWC